tara:strand:+ start:88 stop:597 length:510 start_codon:yes stop_codon:yes gene_type:complete
MNKRDLKKFQENYTEFKPNSQNQLAPPAEGVRLAVHFDDKDEVKGWGARWNAEEKYWWLPVRECSATRMREMNHRKMIAGLYGNVRSDDHAANWVNGDECTAVFNLRRDLEGARIAVYEQHDLIQIIGTAENASTCYGAGWHTIAHGRQMWDALMTAGFRRLAETPVSS